MTPTPVLLRVAQAFLFFLTWAVNPASMGSEVPERTPE